MIAKGKTVPITLNQCPCHGSPKNTPGTTCSGTGARGRRWGDRWRANCRVQASPDSDSPPGGRSAARYPRCAAGGVSEASARVALEVARGQVWLLAHTGHTAVAGSGQHTVWARWSVCVGLVWVARSAGEGKRCRWAIAHRASGRRTPAPRDRAGRKKGLVPWQCPRR